MKKILASVITLIFTTSVQSQEKEELRIVVYKKPETTLPVYTGQHFLDLRPEGEKTFVVLHNQETIDDSENNNQVIQREALNFYTNEDFKSDISSQAMSNQTIPKVIILSKQPQESQENFAVVLQQELNLMYEREPGMHVLSSSFTSRINAQPMSIKERSCCEIWFFRWCGWCYPCF